MTRAAGPMREALRTHALATWSMLCSRRAFGVGAIPVRPDSSAGSAVPVCGDVAPVGIRHIASAACGRGVPGALEVPSPPAVVQCFEPAYAVTVQVARALAVDPLGVLPFPMLAMRVAIGACARPPIYRVGVLPVVPVLVEPSRYSNDDTSEVLCGGARRCGRSNRSTSRSDCTSRPVRERGYTMCGRDRPDRRAGDVADAVPSPHRPPRDCTSSAVSARHRPLPRSPSTTGPIATRTSLSTANPCASSIRRI